MMNLLKWGVLLAILFFLGKFAWGYVEDGYAKMNGYNKQIQNEATQSQERRNAETNKALGEHR